MRHEEEFLQISTAKFVRMFIDQSQVICHHSANERHGAAAGGKAKSMGQLAGFPDWIFIWSSELNETIVCFVELKSKNGRQSEGQKLFQNLAKETGSSYYICRSLQEFIDALNDAGVPHLTSSPP